MDKLRAQNASDPALAPDRVDATYKAAQALENDARETLRDVATLFLTLRQAQSIDPALFVKRPELHLALNFLEADLASAARVFTKLAENSLTVFERKMAIEAAHLGHSPERGHAPALSVPSTDGTQK